MSQAVSLGVLLLVVTGQSHGQTPDAVGPLLDKYRSGSFDDAVSILAATPTVEGLRESLVRGADAWMMSQSSDLATRRLVAASFVLEVAHARLRRDNASTIVLLDWANRQFSRAPSTVAERRWMVAAVALVERASRDGSLTLSKVGGGVGWGEAFIARAVRRFPDEPRLRLAQVVWRASHGRTQGVERDLGRLVKDPAVGADALVQLGYLRALERDYEGGLRTAQQAADASSSAATRYIAAFLSGFCYEALRRSSDAMAAYRAALTAVPHGQSASLALAQLLMREHQGEEALELIDASLLERPHGDDPWRLFTYGGYIHWPQRISELRQVLQ